MNKYDKKMTNKQKIIWIILAFQENVVKFTQLRAPPEDVSNPDTTPRLVFRRFTVLYNKRGAAAAATSAMGNKGNGIVRQTRNKIGRA